MRVDIHKNVHVYIHMYICIVTLLPHVPHPFVLTVNLTMNSQYFPLFCDNQILVAASRFCMIGKSKKHRTVCEFHNGHSQNAQFLILFIVSSFMALGCWLWAI